MAIDKEKLKTTITQAFRWGLEQTDQSVALDEVAAKLADAVTTAIRSITITYTTGLVAPSTGGPVTGTFECTIN